MDLIGEQIETEEYISTAVAVSPVVCPGEMRENNSLL